MTDTTHPAPTADTSWHRIHQCILDVPYSAGVTHPAEDLLLGHTFIHGFEDVLERVHTGEEPEELLYILGRLTVEQLCDADVRRGLVEWGLAHELLSQRDAAIQAIERWEDADLAVLLKDFKAPDAPWLEEYARGVHLTYAPPEEPEDAAKAP